MWTLQDAKNRFSTVVDAALQGRPQEVTRRGRPAVVVVAAEEYQRLVTVAAAVSAGTRESFAAHLLAFPGTDPDMPPDRMQARPRDVMF